jgi:hypothetical protein
MWKNGGLRWIKCIPTTGVYGIVMVYDDTRASRNLKNKTHQQRKKCRQGKENGAKRNEGPALLPRDVV